MPCAHVVGPVYPWPPHCAYRAAVPPPPLGVVDVAEADVLVLVTRVVLVVVALLLVEVVEALVLVVDVEYGGMVYALVLVVVGFDAPQVMGSGPGTG